jgi:hypothetical protein
MLTFGSQVKRPGNYPETGLVWGINIPTILTRLWYIANEIGIRAGEK